MSEPLWVPWERVQALLDAGNILADNARDQAIADEWDAARYKVIPRRIGPKSDPTEESSNE